MTQQYPQPQQQPYPQPHQQQQYAPQPYPQPHQQQQYAPQHYPSADAGPGPALAAGSPPCDFCGSVPSTRAAFRSIVGLLLAHQMSVFRGEFCRDCGLHLFRKQATRTLAGGFFSITALLVTPVVMLMNLVARQRVARLAPPRRYAQGKIPGPLSPGVMVFRRPTAYVYPGLLFGIPLALTLWRSLA